MATATPLREPDTEAVEAGVWWLDLGGPTLRAAKTGVRGRVQRVLGGVNCYLADDAGERVLVDAGTPRDATDSGGWPNGCRTDSEWYN